MLGGRFLVQPAYNREPIGETEATTQYLNRMAQEGWVWEGQMVRKWNVGGRIEFEILDVFRSE